ncbi:hypothetical protein V6N13_108697 [Hibiscus sabdariffa]
MAKVTPVAAGNGVCGFPEHPRRRRLSKTPRQLTSGDEGLNGVKRQQRDGSGSSGKYKQHKDRKRASGSTRAYQRQKRGKMMAATEMMAAE